MSKDSSKSKRQAITVKNKWLQKLLVKKTKTDKGFGRPWRIVITVIVIFVLSQVLAAFIVELMIAIMHSASNPGGSLDQSAPAQFFYILLAESGAILLVIKTLQRRGLNLASIGLGRRPKAKDITRALLGFAAFYALLIVAGALLTFLFPSLSNGPQQDVGFNTLHGSLDYLLAFIALVAFPPLGEEILVRGYLYSGLRSRWNMLPAMLVTSLFFGAAHLQLGSGTATLWAAGADTFILSIVLVYLREKTGALYAGMMVHSLNNIIAFGTHFHALMF